MSLLITKFTGSDRARINALQLCGFFEADMEVAPPVKAIGDLIDEFLFSDINIPHQSDLTVATRLQIEFRTAAVGKNKPEEVLKFSIFEHAFSAQNDPAQHFVGNTNTFTARLRNKPRNSLDIPLFESSQFMQYLKYYWEIQRNLKDKKPDRTKGILNADSNPKINNLAAFLSQGLIKVGFEFTPLSLVPLAAAIAIAFPHPDNPMPALLAARSAPKP